MCNFVPKNLIPSSPDKLGIISEDVAFEEAEYGLEKDTNTVDEKR